jgi:hypothetical protein
VTDRVSRADKVPWIHKAAYCRMRDRLEQAEKILRCLMDASAMMTKIDDGLETDIAATNESIDNVYYMVQRYQSVLKNFEESGEDEPTVPMMVLNEEQYEKFLDDMNSPPELSEEMIKSAQTRRRFK